MSDTPLLAQVQQLFSAQAAPLFGLCYLHAAGPRGAYKFLDTLLCDLLTSPRQWRLACSGTPGLFRCAQQVCMDQYLKRPKRQKKKSAPALRAVMPFPMTDGLRAILRLPARYKAPLYLRLALGWSIQDTAAAAGVSPGQVDKLVRRGLKRAKSTEEKARQLLCAITPPEDAAQQVWDGFLVSQEERGFRGRQRLRQFKRWMDNAIPFIALGTVVLCVVAYYSVELGWFGGGGYVPTVPLEGYTSSALEAAEKGELTVFVPEGEGFAQYIVTDAPRTFPALVREMVALGGAPEGAAALSAEQGGQPPSLVMGQGPVLTLELSSECAAWFSTAAPGQQKAMLTAMALTLQASCGPLEELHIVSSGEELAAGDVTAGTLISLEVEPLRTATTPYQE